MRLLSKPSFCSSPCKELGWALVLLMTAAFCKEELLWFGFC